MSESKTKKSSGSLGATLTKTPKLPRIGSVLYGYGDIGLGFAHNYALDIAREVLSEKSQKTTEKLYKDIMMIFVRWKNECGKVHPSQRQSIALLLLDTPEPEKPITEQERLVQIKSLTPWQCHASATTPIALFNQLFYEEYKPLKDYIDKNWSQYPYIQAMLILISHDPDSDNQSSDCIYEATKLALWHLRHKKGLIEIMMPDAQAMWKARQNSKRSRQAKKKEKNADIDKKVAAAYQDFCIDGNVPSAIQRHIQRATRLNQTEVSRSMARLGLSTRKKKNCISDK